MNVTIRDIAKASGYSCATISRVLSNYSNVNEETRRIVLGCIKQLDYKYKPSTNYLNPADKKIMLIVGDLENMFYVSIIKTIGDILAKNRCKVAIFNSNYDPKVEEDYLRFAQQDNYSGIVMLTAVETPELIELLKKKDIPVILVNRFIRSLDMNVVSIDNYQGGYKATDYLIRKGHKRIAHLSGPLNSTASYDRLQGYKDALKDSGLAINEKAIYTGNLRPDSGSGFGEYFLNKLSDYTAVFCANDIMAVAFMEKVIQAGFKIPDDISIISFDDSPVAVSKQIKLTTISWDPKSMGEAATEIMLQKLKDKVMLNRKVIFSPILIERNSVKCLVSQSSLDSIRV